MRMEKQGKKSQTMTLRGRKVRRRVRRTTRLPLRHPHSRHPSPPQQVQQLDVVDTATRPPLTTRMAPSHGAAASVAPARQTLPRPKRCVAMVIVVPVCATPADHRVAAPSLSPLASYWLEEGQSPLQRSRWGCLMGKGRSRDVDQWQEEEEERVLEVVVR